MESAGGALKIFSELSPLAAVLVFLAVMVWVVILLWRGSEKWGIPGLGREWAELKKYQIEGNEIARKGLEVMERIESRILKDVDETKADLKAVNYRVNVLEIELAALRGPASSRAGAAVPASRPTPLPPMR